MNPWTPVLLAVFFRTMLCVSGSKLCCRSPVDYGCTKEYDGTDLKTSDCPDKLKPTFHLYTKTQRSTPREFTVGSVPLKYLKKSRTIFIVHGFGDHPNADWLLNLKTALLDKGEENIIIVDWEDAAKKRFSWDLGYSRAVADTYGVSLALKAVAQNIVDAGIPHTELWCIGHSLGAHLCGHAGLVLKFGRITGLDPAGPLWKKYNRGLSSSSATFVDVIHTDGSGLYYFGLLKPLGHADFYPNGGKRQPGCQWPLNWKVHCSHMRAVYYFINSVKENCFISRNKCENYKQVTNKCKRVKGTLMGYGAVSSSRGLFYVPIKSKRPYCKG